MYDQYFSFFFSPLIHTWPPAYTNLPTVHTAVVRAACLRRSLPSFLFVLLYPSIAFSRFPLPSPHILPLLPLRCFHQHQQHSIPIPSKPHRAIATYTGNQTINRPASAHAPPSPVLPPCQLASHAARAPSQSIFAVLLFNTHPCLACLPTWSVPSGTSAAAP
ncbi:hypothetical protein BKA81DRAFT_121122 [Phyllosticta paracitricarpa]